MTVRSSRRRRLNGRASWLRRRVPGRCCDVETAREIERRPARADHSCADDRHVANLLIVCHEKAPFRILNPRYHQILSSRGLTSLQQRFA